MEKEYRFATEKPKRNLMKWTPQFSLEERDRRWAVVREKMAQRDLDCLFICGLIDTYYLTQTGNGENANALFPLEGEPVAYYGMRPYDYYMNYGIGQNWVRDCRRHTGLENILDAAKTLKEWGLEKGNFGYTGQNNARYRGRGALGRQGIPGFARGVHARLPEAGGFINCSYIMEDLMMIKSPEEIKFHEKAAEIQEYQFEVLKKTATTPGATEADLHANMIQAGIQMGADSSTGLGGMIDVAPFPFLHGRMIGGVPGGVSMRPIQRGDMIILEWGVRYAGCNSYVEQSLSLGEPRKEFKEIMEVMKEGFIKGVDALRPGNSFEKAVQALRGPINEAGMRYLELGFVANGTSANLVYPPPGEEFLDGASEEHFSSVKKGYYMTAPFTIKPNMMFRCLMDVYNPRWKESALMCGRIIHTTEAGPRVLPAKIPYELTIL